MFRLVIRIFCLLTHTFLAHLTWLVSQRWSVASSLNQVFARKQHSQEASVCACVCKIHISLMTENVDSGRLGPALCSDTSEPRHTDRVWTVDTVVGEGLPRLLLKLHQWVHTSGCAGSAVQLMDAEHQIQVYIQKFEWGGWADLSRSALNPVICRVYESRMTGDKSPCRLLEAKSVPGWANGAVPAHRRICSGACITKQHELSLGWTQV